MIYKKKLIEVALPLEAINRESAREKSNPFLIADNIVAQLTLVSIKDSLTKCEELPARMRRLSSSSRTSLRKAESRMRFSSNDVRSGLSDPHATPQAIV
jgi:hypothetical protein